MGIPPARGRKPRPARQLYDASGDSPRARTEVSSSASNSGNVGGFPARADGRRAARSIRSCGRGIPRARGRKLPQPLPLRSNPGDSPRARTEAVLALGGRLRDGGFPARADGRAFEANGLNAGTGIPRARGRKSRPCPVAFPAPGDSPRARTEGYQGTEAAGSFGGFPARADGRVAVSGYEGEWEGIPRARGRKRASY